MPPASPNPSRTTLTDASPDLLAGLNSAQQSAVLAPSGRVVVLAGAGSGKTRVLSRRIAWRIAQGEIDPARVLALTFTRKAAAELCERQRRLGLRDSVPAGTFHRFALTQLRERWADSNITPPTLLTNRIGFVARLLNGTARSMAGDITAEIDWARARLITPDRYGGEAERAARRPPIPAADLAEIMVRFAQEKKRRRVVDFDDLLTLAIRDLESDPSYAEAVRWRHRHFFVDEFQDVNALQHRLLSCWLGDRDDLFIVGDPNQAIYGWNGADPALLQSLASSANALVVRLDDNYRSSPEILRVAGASLDVDPSLVAHRPNGPTPSITAYPDDEAEAHGIAERIRAGHSAQSRWSDQAVLTRTNAQLTVIERILGQWHIPCEVRSGSGPLDRPEVKAVVGRIERGEIDVVEALEQLDDQLAVDTSRLSARALDRHHDLAALSRLIHEYLTTDDRPSGSGLVAWLSLMSSQDLDTGPDAVSLLSFHSAKGLEWPIVHLAGLEDGYCPIAYAETDDQRAEEQRLLYVALTRAERELHLSWARQRTFGAKVVEREASPLLLALDRRVRQLGPGGRRPVDWQGHLATTRRRLDKGTTAKPRTPGGDDALLEDLQRWRDRKAKAARVPTHVIAPDTILRSVVRHKPTTLAELGAVSGLGPAKLNRLGAELLDLVSRAGAGQSTS